MKSLRKIIGEELSFLYAFPAWLWQCFFLYLPLLILLWKSVVDYGPSGYPHISFKHYARIIDSLYFKIILTSFSTAFVTTVICLLIAYPVAYFLAFKAHKRFRTFLLFSIIFPSWTSLIVQIYAWFFLLDRNGFFCQWLYKLHLLPRSMQLLNNYFAIIIGMVSCFLPFMILPIYAVLERIDNSLIEASADLGANRLHTLKRVIFPLSLHGVYAGCLLVFIPSFGEFAIPTLLGGSRDMFWGNVIVDKFLRSRDWSSGAALAMMGMFLPFIIILGSLLVSRVVKYYRKQQRNRLLNKEPW